MPSYITQEGKQKLVEELNHLKAVRRKEVAERIRNAAAQGDLSENFDYADAKEEQEGIERRIAEIEATLSGATLAPAGLLGDAVQIGSTVVVQDGAENATFVITGPQEASPAEGKISANSPIGAALLGKKVGEEVAVDTPGGTTTYKVAEIR